MASLARRIAEGSLMLTSRTLIMNLAGLASTILLVRYLGKFDYGLYALFLSAINLANIGMLQGLNGVVIADVAREKGEGNLGTVKALLLRFGQVKLFLGLLAAVILILLYKPVYSWHSQKVAVLVLIIAAAVPLRGMKEFLKIIFSSHASFRNLGAVDVAESISRLAFIALVVVFDLGFLVAVSAHIAAIIVSLVIALPMSIHTCGYLRGIKRSKEGTFYRMLRGHGKYNILMDPIKKVRGRSVPWIVQFFLGVEAVAVFSVAKRGMEFFRTLIKPIGGVYLPLISSELSKGARRVNEMMTRGIKYILMISATVVVVTFAIAPFLFRLLFGEGYLESVPLFRIFLLQLLIAPSVLVLRPVFMAYRGQKYLFYSMGISTAVQIGGIFALTPLWGLTGTVAGFVMGPGSMATLMYYYLKKLESELKVDARLIFSIDKYDRWLTRKVVRKLQEKFMQMVQR